MKNKELLFEMVRNNLKKLSKNQLIDQHIDALWYEARPQLFNNLSQKQYETYLKNSTIKGV